MSTDAIGRGIARDHGETDAEFVPLERWDGPWTADDHNANFKADVALYAQADPMTTIRGLAEAVDLPVGAIVRYVLARYATTGSRALLELGPSMVHRLWEPIGSTRHYNELREMISWLRAPLVDPTLAASDYRCGSSLPPVED